MTTVAIEASIKHWYENLGHCLSGDLDSIHTSSIECALCMSSKYDDGRTMNCDVCPLHLAGHGCLEDINDKDNGDYMSPYNDVTDTLDEMGIYDSENMEPLTIAIRRMITTLEGLR